MARERNLWLVLGALMTCLLLSALDQTIVATALPTIVGDLGGLEHLSWVVTAYLLSSTVSMPLFGKISDLYGRKIMLQVTVVIFLMGSMLAGLSQNMLMLILFRGIQGVGGGGILSMTFTILGDILSPRERSKYTGYFTGVFAGASVMGPLAGGFFVDNLSWRWVFYVNIPLGALCLVVTGLFLHVPKPTERRPLDLRGAALLTVAVTSLLLTMTWGGREYPWTSPLVVGLGVLGVAGTALFFVSAAHSPEPILPLHLFRNPVFTVCIALAVLLGSVTVCGAAFLPLYLQVVKGVSATSSGFLLVPMMGGLLVGSNISGRIVARTGRYKIVTVIGTVMAVSGIAVLSTIQQSSPRTLVSTGMALLGLGIGSAGPITTIAVQNVVGPRDMGAATSAVNFFRSMASAFAVALFGTVMNSRLTATLHERLPGTDLAGQRELFGNPKLIRALPVKQFDAMAAGITSGVSTVFKAAIPIVIIAFVVSWFLKEVPLRDDLEIHGTIVEGMEEMGIEEDLEPEEVAANGLVRTPADGREDVRPHS